MLSRAEVLSFVAAALIAVKFIFGVEPPPELGGEITDWIMKGATIGAILYNLYKTIRSKKGSVEPKA